MINLIGTVSVAKGDAGEEVLIRNNNRISIDWKYGNEDEDSWRVIETFENMNGEEILLNVSDTHIQWKYTRDVEWFNLISIEELTPSIAHLESDYEELSSSFRVFDEEARNSENNRIIGFEKIENTFDALVDGTGFTSLEKFNDFKDKTGIRVIDQSDETPRNEGVFYFVKK